VAHFIDVCLMGRLHDHKDKHRSYPFQLLYGQEVVMPVELELTSLRLDLQDEDLNFDKYSSDI
jgi:hypothetical protein